jgi:hypothetical protein
MIWEMKVSIWSTSISVWDMLSLYPTELKPMPLSRRTRYPAQSAGLARHSSSFESAKIAEQQGHEQPEALKLS